MSGKRNAAEWMKARIKHMPDAPGSRKDRQQKLRKTQIHAEKLRGFTLACFIGLYKMYVKNFVKNIQKQMLF